MSRFAASGVARSSASSNSASAARLLQLPPTIHAASIRVVANSIAIALHAQSTTYRTYLDIGTAVRTRRRSAVNLTTCVVHNPRNSIDRPTRACRFVAHLVVRCVYGLLSNPAKAQVPWNETPNETNHYVLHEHARVIPSGVKLSHCHNHRTEIPIR